MEFRYFELRNIYKQIPSHIRIPILSELASSLIDSGVGLVLSSYMVRFSRSIEQRKQIYSYEANSLGVVWCSYNERTNHRRRRRKASDSYKEARWRSVGIFSGSRFL